MLSFVTAHRQQIMASVFVTLSHFHAVLREHQKTSWMIRILNYWLAFRHHCLVPHLHVLCAVTKLCVVESDPCTPEFFFVLISEMERWNKTHRYSVFSESVYIGNEWTAWVAEIPALGWQVQQWASTWALCEYFVYSINWVNRSCLGLIYSLSSPHSGWNSMHPSSPVNPRK